MGRDHSTLPVVTRGSPVFSGPQVSGANQGTETEAEVSAASMECVGVGGPCMAPLAAAQGARGPLPLSSCRTFLKIVPDPVLLQLPAH